MESKRTACYGLFTLLFGVSLTLRTPLQTKLKNCRLLLNEWNTGCTDPEMQFVELKAYCRVSPKIKSNVDLSRYRLVVINPMQEVMVSCRMDLRKSFISRTEFYFVFGGDKVPNSDMPLRNCQVDSFLRDVRGFYLPSGVGYPFAMLLLYNQQSSALNITDLDTDQTGYKSRRLSEVELEKLGQWTQDMYVFGASTFLVTCEVYVKILSLYSSERAIIARDWQTNSSLPDQSINRCTALEDDRSFLPSALGYALPSPGLANSCGDGFQFFFETFLSQVRHQKMDVPTPLGMVSCYKIVDELESTDALISPEEFEAQMEIAQEEQCAPEPMDEDSSMESQEPFGSNPVVEAGDFDMDLSSIPNEGSSYIWQDCSSFPTSWKSALEEDPDTPLPVGILGDPRVCFWYEYIVDKGLGRCKLCNAIIEQGIVYKSRLDKIMREGYMYRTQTKNKKNINRRKIMYHTTTDIHNISVQYFSYVDKGLRGANLTRAMLEPGSAFVKYYTPTQNLIIAVYQAVKMGFSFRSFKIFTETLKFFRVNVGHVHSGDAGMKTVLMHIERMMRSDLSKYLRLHRPEISITLDSSVDVGGQPSLAVLFTTFVDKNKPKVFFYRLLPLKGESGVDLFNAFKAALEEDGIDQYMRERISGYVSDGCSVMTSTFRVELEKWAQSGFINTWCLNHRLELITKTSLRNLEVVKQVEAKINSLASFFGAISPKKRRILEQVALTKGFSPFTLQRVHDIRWSESKYKAMVTIMSRWPVILEALQKVSDNPTFKATTKTTARKLKSSLRDGTFLSTLAFLIDVMELSSQISLVLQERGTSLIGKKALLLTFKDEIASLSSTYGKSLSSLLQNSRIQEQGQTKVPTLEDLETKEVTYLGENISPSGSYNSSYYLYANREEYVERILARVEFYFSANPAMNFDIFDPIEMEANIDNQTFADKELRAMNQQYHWQYNDTTLLKDWHQLHTSVVLHPQFPELATTKPVFFWSQFLDFDDDEISWTDSTRGLIRKVISVSASSSEAERIFSISNAQKTKRRYNLKVETLSALVSIRFNGASDLRQLDSFRYAQEFVRYHAKADDKRSRSSQSVDDDEDFFLAPFEPNDDELNF